jgi:hypothetical protein
MFNAPGAVRPLATRVLAAALSRHGSLPGIAYHRRGYDQVRPAHDQAPSDDRVGLSAG